MENPMRSTLSPERRHLTRESIMRIQITLSSRKSSVVVFNTYARLVAVGDGKWDSVAVGAPCIILLKETSAPDSPFQVRLAIAEVESGIAIWEEEISLSADYTELQPTFHTFTSADGQSLAMQFADAVEASSLLDCLNQYIRQKNQTDQMLEEKKSKDKKKKKAATLKEKRVSKIDISSPCEFRHLSGISAGQPNGYQQELEQTLTRRQRSSSMSAISSKSTSGKQRGKLPKEMAADGKVYKSKSDKRKSDIPALSNIKRDNHGLFKSSSVRITKRRPIIDHMRPSDDSSIGSTPSHTSGSRTGMSNSSSTQASAEHSYWTIDDLQNNRTKQGKSTMSNDSPDHEPSITFKNSAPSQIQQAWRHSLTNEDMSTSSKSSRSSTPHHLNSGSMIPPLGFPQPASGSFIEKRNTWTNGMGQQSPTHSQLNTSPDHQFTTLSNMSTPAHVIAAANAKKYMHVKPTFNTYDTLLPLGPNEQKKLPPLAPMKKKNTAASSDSHADGESENKDPSKPTVTAIHAEETSPTQSDDTTVKQKSVSAAKPFTTPKPPPLAMKQTEDNRIVTPPAVSSPGDLDVLSAELSRVLKDFDSLITPNSPLVAERGFQFPQTNAKETMV